MRAPRPSARPFALALLALASAACAEYTQVSDHCPTVESTGGDPTGEWSITESCQVPYARTTTDDWCSRLVYEEEAVKDGLFLGNEFLPLKNGESKIVYAPDATCGQNCGTYEATLIFEGETTTHFPRGCLSQHIAGADGNCADLQTKMQTLVESNVLPTIQNVMCSDEPDGSGGCACKYLVTTKTIAVDVGSWRVLNGLLVHYPSTLAQAGLTDVAISGDSMLLHGHKGMPLLAHEPLRFLSLTRVAAP